MVIIWGKNLKGILAGVAAHPSELLALDKAHLVAVRARLNNMDID